MIEKMWLFFYTNYSTMKISKTVSIISLILNVVLLIACFISFLFARLQQHDAEIQKEVVEKATKELEKVKAEEKLLKEALEKYGTN